MKIVLIVFVIAVAILFVYLYTRKSSSTESVNGNTKPIEFFSLNDGNQTELILFIEVSKSWIDSTKVKYDWDEFDVYDNRMFEYMYKLFDETIEKSGIKDYNELWNKLTREQKIFWAFLVFNGDTDNGGVSKFVFNRQEFVVAVAELWDELEMNELKTDYEELLTELIGKEVKISEFKTVYNDKSNDVRNRWRSFTEGQEKLKSAKKIEDYYYNVEFKKKLYRKVAELIESNMDKFALVK